MFQLVHVTVKLAHPTYPEYVVTVFYNNLMIMLIKNRLSAKLNYGSAPVYRHSTYILQIH